MIRVARVALVILTALVAACGRPAMVIPNVTHIDGIPFDQYDPAQYDPREDLVVTVGGAQAQAAPPPAAVAAVPPPPQAAPAPPPAEPEGTSGTDLVPDVPVPDAPAAPPAAAPTPGVPSATALIDGQAVQVSMTSAATGPATAEAVVQVSGLGGKDIVDAIRAYSQVCEVGYEQVLEWINAGGRVSRSGRAGDVVLWTDVCPGLAKYVRT